MKDKKFETYEEVSIKDKMVDKLLTESSFVLDLIEKKIIKNRFEYSSDKSYTFDSVMEYLRKNHKNVVDVEEKYNEMVSAFNEAIDSIEEKLETVEDTEAQ
jgi:hypothetical protein